MERCILRSSVLRVRGVPLRGSVSARWRGPPGGRVGSATTPNYAACVTLREQGAHTERGRPQRPKLLLNGLSMDFARRERFFELVESTDTPLPSARESMWQRVLLFVCGGSPCG